MNAINETEDVGPQESNGDAINALSDVLQAVRFEGN